MAGEQWYWRCLACDARGVTVRTAAMVEAGQAPGYPPGWARAPREIGVQCQVCAKGSGQLSLLDPLPPGSCEHPERR